jgi:thiol:disulfide interchange protein DsbC
MILLAILALALTSAVFADEKSVRRAVEKKLQGIQVESVRKTPFNGLYEVDFEGGRILYVDEKVNFVLSGRLLDVRQAEPRDLTAERMDALHDAAEKKLPQIDFAKLPKELAIKIVKGDGSRQFAVFSDPDCPYCKKLESELAQLDNYTMYVYLYPIPQLHPDALEHSRNVWCSADRVQAWNDLMQRNVLPKPAAKDCQAPLEDIARLGRDFHFDGTPSLIFANGKRNVGYLPAAALEKALAANAK